MKNIFLVNFILLHGYSLDNSSLMFGKMGYSLILFEYSHYFKDALAEKHAFELLQEVLASPMKSNTFNEGKMGIAWSLIHLIEKEYIEADYLELYGQEHKEIVAFIKQLKTDMNNIVSKSDAISFLITSKSYIPESDIDEIVPNLIENLCDYLKLIPKSLFERNLFYYHATKVLCQYNLYEELNIDIIVQTHRKLISDKYVCTNISFGVNLLQYGLYHKRKDIIKLANTITKCYFSNMVLETLNLKEAIDTIYNLNKLQLLNKKSEWSSLKEELSNLLFNKESYLYKGNRLTLNRLKGGIPQLLLMKCLNFQDIRSTGHYLMQQ